MRTVHLTKGYEAVVSDEDYEEVSKYKWQVVVMNKKFLYALHKFKRKTISLHRFLTKPPKGFWVDHRDGNGLNNTRENLRVCTPQQNAWNRRGHTEHKGVWSYNSKKNPWIASICIGGIDIHLGSFKTIEEATEAYERKAKEVHGDFFFQEVKNE